MRTKRSGSFSVFGALLLAPLLVTCATTQGGSSSDFVPTGEMEFLGTGASFNATRVVGPQVNMGRRSDGSWGGVLQRRPMDLSVEPGKARGVELQLAWTQTPQKTVITGQYQGRILRFEYDQEQLLVRTPSRSLTLYRKGPNHFGPMGEMVVKGEAALPEPPMPQFAFALVATF